MELELDEFIKAHKWVEFKAQPVYNVLGDFIIQTWQNESAFARYINEYLDLYLSIRTNDIVGIKVHGISKIIRRAEIELEHNPKRIVSIGQIDKLGRFTPNPVYLPENGTFKIFWEDTKHYAVYIHGGLTIFRAMDDNRVVGACIAGLKDLIHSKKNGE